MTIGTWSDFDIYDDSNVDNNARDEPGVYRLSSKKDNGNYYVFYVGKSDTSLKQRLKDHLSTSETNTCIKSELTKTCGYRFVYVTTQKERDDLEIKQIEKYKPKCNTQNK